MKNRFIVRTFGVLALLSAAIPAWSIPLATVGSNDHLLASTVLANSGDAYEAAWASGILGFDLAFDSKIEGSAAWTSVDGVADLYAIDFSVFGDEPAYYLVKTGGGKKYEGSTHFLFENLASFQYGVVSLGDLGLEDFSVERISHVSTFDGHDSGADCPSVPEPGTLALFGMGMLAIGTTRRRGLARTTRT